MSRDWTIVARLLEMIALPPEASEPQGASEVELRSLELRLGRALPLSLTESLLVVNGLCAGGGIFGGDENPEYLRISYYLDLFPAWREKNWLPVAGDGCGNYYVLLPETELGFSPVAFVDLSEGGEEISYVVASDMYRFMCFYLNNEIHCLGWPHDYDYVKSEDPDIINIGDLRLPWRD